MDEIHQLKQMVQNKNGNMTCIILFNANLNKETKDGDGN